MLNSRTSKDQLLVSKMVAAIVKNLSEQMSHSDVQIWPASQEIKYLSINETDGVNNAQIKAKIMKEYYRQIHQVLKTELSSKNNVTAINPLAVLVVDYSSYIVEWLRTNSETMNCRM